MKKTDEYLQQEIQQTFHDYDVELDQGLNKQQVDERLNKYGYNELEQEQESLLHRIVRRFWGPIPWMIEVAAFLSALVQKWEDFIIIVFMLLVNAFLDFFQEHRALNALQALKQTLTREVIVLRDGHYIHVPSRELVPGDIIKLQIGDIVSADVQLVSGNYLLIDQSSLTGESLPVSKKIQDIAYANTIIKQGEMLAIVINTAANTNFQNVVSLVSQAGLEERSHFQTMMIKIGNFLILITIALVLLVIMVSLFRHENFIEIARFAMVLTVAAIPVALPAVLSVTMAVGAMNLARHHAIVSKLTAIEELAGVDIFCTDKTGTLTKNQMQVKDPITLNGFTEEELFLVAGLASKLENSDPIDYAIFHYIDEYFTDLDLSAFKQLEYIPFDPVRKRTEGLIEKGNERFTVIKGAAQILIEMTDLSDNEIIDINNMVELLASKGYRTIAVGKQTMDSALVLVGLIPLYDPPREDSVSVIDEMRKNGVAIKMITGDNIAIAREVGKVLGLQQRTISSAQLSGTASNEVLKLTETLASAIYSRINQAATHKEAKLFAQDVMVDVHKLYDTTLLEHEFVHTHESAIVEMIEEIDIFAEVVPEDKYRIVDTLQKANHIVAMTGDGVNDAPALKKADCGIAVSNATDAARAAADIILTAPGLCVINDAVKQARITFERMRSYAVFRIAETIRIILFMSFSIVIFNFYPITALMIILLALLNDIPILAIAYDNTKVNKKPVRWNMSEVFTVATILGLTGVISSFILFYILQTKGMEESLIQTLLFLKLIVAGHSTLYITRAQGWFWQKPYPAPILLLATFGTEVIATFIAVYGVFMTEISWEYAAYIWAYAFVWLVFNDIVKMMVYNYLRRRDMPLFT